jgi:hypothetical protein
MLLLSEYLSGLVGNLAVSSLVIHVPSKGVCANNTHDASSVKPNSNVFIGHLSEILAAQQKGSALITHPHGVLGGRLVAQL